MTEETKDAISEDTLDVKPGDPVTKALIRMQRNLKQILTIVLVAIPVVFALGVGGGYLMWGRQNESEAPAVAANPAPAQQDTDSANSDASAPPQAITIPEDIERYEIEIFPDDPVQGPDDALVTIIEFSDFECPYCRKYSQETYTKIIENYGDQVRYIFKDLPLVSIHPNAVPAAAAAQCAQEQDAFWEFHDLLFTMELGLNTEAYLNYAERLNLEMVSFETCVSEGRYNDTVLLDTNILTEMGAPMSTPTFFINGIYLSGAQPYELFSELIQHELGLVN